MKCPHCGAPLKMEDKFCTYCGAPNTLAMQHQADMEHYEREFTETQEEVLTKHEHYSEFQYKVCLTQELTTELLAMGENIEVLEPQELREEMKKKLETSFNLYK